MKFIGFDLETTGSTDRDEIIQIGAFYEGAVFSMDVRSGVPMHPEARVVTGFTDQRIAAGASSDLADAYLFAWLEAHGLAGEEKAIVPVGFNVGSFDVPFVKRQLPLSAALFSYRSVDLNSVMFTLEAAGHGGFDKLKKRAKSAAAALIESTTIQALRGLGPHDAAYDAAMAIQAWRYLITLSLQTPGKEAEI